MRAVIQRAARAQVSVAGEVVGELDRPGIVALIGVTHDDGPDQAVAIARKIAELRIMRDERSLLDLGAPVLVISQFTLYGATKKGRRPTWSAAAPSATAEPLVTRICAELEGRGLDVATGEFGADMAVELVNDGPVTLILDA